MNKRSADSGMDTPRLVQELLTEAIRRCASDVQLEPTAGAMALRYRIDGLLQTVRQIDAAAGRAMVTRLMVMAGLLTYRLDVPQEGRLELALGEGQGTMDLRLAIMPTTHGLRAAVRLPAELRSPTTLDELGLAPHIVEQLERFASAESGGLILTGPAGCGKTTTIYALLRHIVATQPGLSVIALEDPVERDLPGVTQIQVSPFGQLTYETALKSIMRQDPQVLMIGEIRDPATASIAIGAALSGHRLITTLHAGSPATALTRLMEMGLEPYQITSSVAAVMTQRLLRRRRPEDAADAADSTGAGRVAAGEWASMDEDIRRAILERADAATITQHLHRRPGYQTLHQAANTLIEQGIVERAEARRIVGAPTVSDTSSL